MTFPLIPENLLQKSDKILFIAHLALGDYTYLQNCFHAFAQAYPHLQVHLWVDEVRRTADAAEWPHLENYALYDWVDASACFAKVYRRTYSPALYRDSIAEAQREHYPLVVSLATLRPHLYAALARAVSPQGFVVGIKSRVPLLQPQHYLAYRKIDAALLPYSVDRANVQHISAVYAGWFRQLCGLEVAPAARLPFVDIPESWRLQARERLAAWGFAPRAGKLVFINPYAKTHKRCWPLERVAELIAAMQDRDGWRDACFVVNAVPQELAKARAVIAGYGLARAELFSAEENFFQLPALLAECELIISVETAVMHLANAVHVPVIALMRQKNPEWVPIDAARSTVITAQRRRDWVKAISVAEVMAALP
ncbi:glycosyltransferase family 9 protein [Janthinobacterium sp.]|uniref:glycosyltransferase family 9 protein n=1 Tax=Janthinobacterium sp. TaxID=1871054 RepID=UPI00293D8326|nr:glycosyltransferase family 9 protein [Janthinobacterium sp.]